MNTSSILRVTLVTLILCEVLSLLPVSATSRNFIINNIKYRNSIISAPSIESALGHHHHHNLLSAIKQPLAYAVRIRGGQANADDHTYEDISSTEKTNPMSQIKKSTTGAFGPIMSVTLALGKNYASLLEKSPILTKSVTAGLIFGLSDYTAQALESDKTSSTTSKNWTRIITATLVGLLYFGPAAHAWYGMIFRILPGTSLISTLQKAALGQAIFGPTFTSIFFATSLMQSGNFSLVNWIRKIKSDLPGAWKAGIGFWPLVDLISYSLISPQWIPLFVNFCSFVWTIYLSIIANRMSDLKDTIS